MVFLNHIRFPNLNPYQKHTFLKKKLHKLKPPKHTKKQDITCDFYRFHSTAQI